jgi:large subunit ribosomal protein L17
MGEVRQGDNAEMCLIELVDFNTLYTKDGVATKAKTRRSRRGGKKADGVQDADVVSETPAAEAKASTEEKKTKKAAAPKKTATKKPKDKE